MTEQLSTLTPGPLARAAGHSAGWIIATELAELAAELIGGLVYLSVLTPQMSRVADRTPPQEDARVQSAAAMMRERLADPITLADIAAEVHLSVYHLVRVFKKETGETPYQHLTRLRIEEAKQLLRRTGLTVGQVASRCGFASAGALSTAFLRHTGTRPSVYRNSSQSSHSASKSAACGYIR
ncbi:helix-turn-helix domain-containing protein [Nocardia sp. NPDC051052]|uniref:helix-turn-helix domain-containing protein n=1 Tax=Nocardia sp. NPDC051052 TaxID=3364322 RepID=UPI00379ACCB7